MEREVAGDCGMSRQKEINIIPAIIGPRDDNWYMWIDALQDIDPRCCIGHSDSKSLCGLLRNPQADLDINMRECLADLLEHVELCRKRGRQKTPVWAISEAEHRWSYASNLVSAHMKRGDTEEEALVKVAKEIGSNKTQLRSVLFGGNHGSFNRAG